MSHNNYYTDKPKKQLQLELNFSQHRYEGICKKCLKEISPRVFDFSTKIFGMPLCWQCQHKPVYAQDEGKESLKLWRGKARLREVKEVR